MIISAIIKAITFYFLYLAIRNVIKMFQMTQQVGGSQQGTSQKAQKPGWNYSNASKQSKPKSKGGDDIEAEYRVID